MMLNNFLPFNVFGIAPILKKNLTGWKCRWCSDVFVPVHATRALYHVIRFKGGGIKPCKASIPANYSARNQAMRDDGSSKSDSKKRGVEVVDDIVMMQQNSSVVTLLAGKRKCGSLSSNSSKSHLNTSHHKSLPLLLQKTSLVHQYNHPFLLVFITRQTFIK